ncbi:MAG TPA: serine hydrolase [Longimicrobiales bacterium]|nr:serine hydrolase [Longimicrobiales bacterium]
MRRLDRIRVLLGVLLLAACTEGPAPGAGQGAALATPAPTRGLDSALVAEVQARAATLPRLHSLLIARHGALLHERYYQGRSADRRANIKSASKSIIATLVGIAIAEGHLEGLDQPIAPFFPQHAAAADSMLRHVTLGHLLSMQAGLEPTSFGNYGEWVSSGNWVRYALTRPFVDRPGGRMLYSTGSTHLLSAILTRATGTSTLEYARRTLMRPLGIELPGWTRDPQGIFFGGNEMALRPRELLRFGELYRNGGRHEGAQLIPAAWIAESWVPRTTSPFNGYGYGRGWWIRRSGERAVFFAWGYGGQYLFIVPELELTVVMTSDATAAREGSHNRALHALLDVLVRAAERGGEASADA